MRAKVSVSGIVQGVGFRPFVYRVAVRNDLRGYVKNRGDAGVEILLEGGERAIGAFLKDLKEKNPPLTQIYDVRTMQLAGAERYHDFKIHESNNETELSGSVIPPDIAICEDCLKELRDPNDPRYEYFFITCTNCGPRFTIIEKLPYDRENTTMRDFPTCDFCQDEYNDPLNRRFHAQTIACPKCGPKAYLTTREGKSIEHKDPIREAGKLLTEGVVLAIKGYGGFHISATTTNDTALAKLREVKHRRSKPFAIMCRDLEATRTFAEVSQKEEELLASYSRPIVLLDKNDNYYLSDLIAPNLHNIGVMLPYTGLHYMLFDRVKEPAFVMTSANPPNQPIVIDNEQALKTLGNTVDYFLFHSRRIAQRCDDSVLRTHERRSIFMRRSRGYTPAPIKLKEEAKQCVIGLGGELNNTACVLNGDKAFISQHIGDVENVETREFLRNATSHLIHLTNSRIETIACDLHPKFTTTILADELANENHWQMLQVQHHYAHTAALMAEHNTAEIIGICCDGYGYGTDGEAWGGEILLATSGSFGFSRLAHLEKQALVGGDLATHYPLRMAAGMIAKRINVENWLMRHVQHLPHGKKEVQVIINQLEKHHSLKETTSCGRALDAAAAILGICYERTYEGEPAIKLESAARPGNDVLKLKPEINGNTLQTSQMLYEIFRNRAKYSVADLAYSVHAYLAHGLAALATEKAFENGIRTVGFTGGTSCNRILTMNMRKAIEAAGLTFQVHKTVPPGDGGLSFGQAVAVGFSAV